MNTTDSMARINTERSVQTSQSRERLDPNFLTSSVEKIMNYENKKKIRLLKPLDLLTYETNHLKTVN